MKDIKSSKVRFEPYFLGRLLILLFLSLSSSFVVCLHPLFFFLRLFILFEALSRMRSQDLFVLFSFVSMSSFAKAQKESSLYIVAIVDRRGDVFVVTNTFYKLEVCRDELWGGPRKPIDSLCRLLRTYLGVERPCRQ